MDSQLFIDLLLEFDEYFLDIHTAASIGCDERVRDIIENSESKYIVDERNKKGWTPLMYAACCANLQVVLLLLEEGAETDVQNWDGHTALILASKCGSGDVVNRLIDSGAKVNVRDARGWTALFYAAAFGHRSVVQLLIERGAVINLVDVERITPLMLAAASGHQMVVRDLLQIKGVNVNEESTSGDTARSVALRNGHINVKNLIDEHCFAKIKGQIPSVTYTDLYTLLKEAQLTKYYPFFENNDIDLNTFLLLTDNDLNEIGIQLFGPRKKICLAISNYRKQHGLNMDTDNMDNILIENKKLNDRIQKLKSTVLHEKNLRTTAEQNLTDNIQRIENYHDSLQFSIGRAVRLAEELKESHEYLKKTLCRALQSMNYGGSNSNSKMDLVLPSLESMRKLIDIQHQNLQKIDLFNFSCK